MRGGREKEEEVSVEQFLEEYERLCKKHGIVVASCDCHDSPWLMRADEKTIEYLIRHLKHVYEKEGLVPNQYEFLDEEELFDEEEEDWVSCC